MRTVARLGLIGGSVAIVLILVFDGSGSWTAGAAPLPSSSPVAASPSIDPSDLEWVSAQELHSLPSDVVQIDCRPGMATLPPYTRFTGFSSMYVLADGRCFIDPSASPFFLNITPKP